MNEAEARSRVGAVAITWLRTPFHDCAQVKGAGVDCATLLKAVFEEAGVIAPFTLDHYSPQHFLHSSEERYVGWVEKFGREIPESQAKPGDVVLYRVEASKCFCHGALITEPGWPRIIHAHYAARRVIKGDGRQPHLGSRVTAMKFYSLFPRSAPVSDGSQNSAESGLSVTTGCAGAGRSENTKKKREP